MINLLKVITTMGIDEIYEWNIKIWLIRNLHPSQQAGFQIHKRSKRRKVAIKATFLFMVPV